MHKLGYNIKYIASEKGLSAVSVANKHKIPQATSDYTQILGDPEVTAVAITVRHNLHARLIIEALQAGKHVFVEKPLALSLEEIEAIENAYAASGKTVTVGFNRRFSPFSTKAKKLIGNSGPINVIATMNAGFIPPESWVHDLKVGGGRIVGEACHLIDLISYFTGSLVTRVVMSASGQHPTENTDNATILLKYQDGSHGVINYFSNGHKAYSKERIEIYSQGRTLVIDNFRKLNGYGFKSATLSKSQDKGHLEQFRLLQECLTKGGAELIPFQQIVNTSRAALRAIDSLKQGTWIDV